MKTNAFVKDVVRETTNRVRVTLPMSLVSEVGWNVKKPVFAKVQNNHVVFKQKKVRDAVVVKPTSQSQYELSICKMFPEQKFEKATKMVFYTEHDTIHMATI